jgi:hypothetical protein
MKSVYEKQAYAIQNGIRDALTDYSRHREAHCVDHENLRLCSVFFDCLCFIPLGLRFRDGYRST